MSHLLLERRILFDYDIYGDSPNCLAENVELAGKIALTQGFGLTEVEFAGFGRLLETNVTIISNEDCYKNLNSIITSDYFGFNARTSIKQTVYAGITDQLLCTEGLIKEKVVGRRNRTIQIITVIFSFHIIIFDV